MGTKIISEPLNRGKITRDADLTQYYIDVHALVERQIVKHVGTLGTCALVKPRRNEDDVEWYWNEPETETAEITVRTKLVDKNNKVVTTFQSTIDVTVSRGKENAPAYATWFSLIIPKRDMKQIKRRCF